MILAFASCSDAPSPDRPVVLELEGDTIQLAPGVRLIDVHVRVGESEFDPAAPSARVGDVIRFRAGDGGSHAVVFEGSQLDAAALEFLERTGQLRGPPLLHEGASWIVSLTDAPPGAYVFRCLTHGAFGRITVTAGS